MRRDGQHHQSSYGTVYEGNYHDDQYEEMRPRTDQPPVVSFGVPVYPDCSEPAAVRFSTRGWKDVWAAVLFALSVAALIAASLTTEIKRSDLPPWVWTSVHTLVTYAPFVVLATIVACVLAISLMRSFPRGYIYGSFIIVFIINCVVTAVAFAHGHIVAGCLMLVLDVLTLTLLLTMGNLIGFSALVLEMAAHITMRYVGVMVTVFVVLILLGVYCLAWFSVLVPAALEMQHQQRMNARGEVDGWLVSGFLLLVFCMYWTSQVAYNVVHVVASGATAAWYFIGESVMPQHPTLPIVRRSFTTSFGSICFGSLLAAITEFLYYIASTQMENSNEFLRCLVLCLLDCLRYLMEKFNNYAFVHVAIYGTSYIESATLTWELISDCGLTLWFNDCLVWPCISVTTLCISVAFGWLVWYIEHDYVLAVALASIVMTTALLFLRPIYASAISQLVCLAESQNAIAISNPEYARRLHEELPFGSPRGGDDLRRGA
jgi:hypothetical protein